MGLKMDNDKINKIAETIVRLETIINEIVVPQSKLSVQKWGEFERLNLKKHLDLNQENSKKIEELNVRIVYIESTRKEEAAERSRIRTLLNKAKNQSELEKVFNDLSVLQKNELEDIYNIKQLTLSHRRVEKALWTYKWASISALSLVFLLYSKIITLDNDFIAKIVSTILMRPF